MRAGDLVGGRYRLDDRLAGGGMGHVWRGLDTRLGRAVAIKLLHSNLSGNRRFRVRFEQEARAVAGLQAPGIVSLFDYGEDHTPDGVVSYLVMELIKGRSLAAALQQRGRSSPATTLRIVASAAEALHAAHQAGIIHRDIKPANMLIDDTGNVKLVDFGIARAVGEAGLTETGMVMGTLSYSSPEQLQGLNPTAATDVYSLGVVAYECLAGRPPFVSDNPGALITGHLQHEPPPLPADVPEPVARIVSRAMAKEPARRWPSAAALARACRDGTAGNAAAATVPTPAAPPTQPIPPPPPTDPMPQLDEEPPARGRRGLMAVAGVVAVLLLTGAALFILEPWATEGDDDANVAQDDGDNVTTEPTSEGSESADGDTSDDSNAEADEAPDSATIPDVDRTMIDDAQSELENAGYHNITIKWATSRGDQEPCEVGRQEPDAGESIPLDGEVTVYAEGSYEYCFEYDSNVFVPNIDGMNVFAAIDVLENAGFYNHDFFHGDSEVAPQEACLVWGQRPHVWEPTSYEDVVEVYYYRTEGCDG